MIKKIRIVIADDHQVLLDGLIMMLKNEDHIEVVGSASNGREALEILSSNEVDVLLMDIQMPIMDGIEASKIAAVRYPKCKIIILSMHNEKAYIERLYETGISGYLLKSAGKEEIIKAINRVFSGEKYYSSEVTDALLQQSKNQTTSITNSELTRREKEILQLIADGLTNQEMASKLFLSIDTVKTHRKNLMRKLMINNTAGLVKYALNNKEE